jgi:hypothetical protein
MSAERAQSGSPPQVVLYQLATAHYLSRAHPRRIDQSLDGRAAATNDVNMLVNTGGRQRSEAEFHPLSDAAGFQRGPR